MSAPDTMSGRDIRQILTVSGERLPRLGDIRVGEQGELRPGEKDKYTPKKLDYFKVFTPKLDDRKRRIIDQPVMDWLAAYNDNPRPKRFPCVFIYNEEFDAEGNLLPSRNFIQYHGLYEGRKCKCRGTGGGPGNLGWAEVLSPYVTKSGKKRAQGTKISCPCSNYDPEANAGTCKPHTVLSCIPMDRNAHSPIGNSGGVYVFRSASVKTADAIKAGFTYYARLARGYIAWLPFELVVEMERTGKGFNVPVVHIESPLSEEAIAKRGADRARKLIEQAEEYKMLMPAVTPVTWEHETAAEQAIVNAEFSPETVDATGVTDIDIDDDSEDNASDTWKNAPDGDGEAASAEQEERTAGDLFSGLGGDSHAD